MTRIAQQSRLLEASISDLHQTERKDSGVTAQTARDLSRAYRALGRNFTAGQMEGFARDIEAGLPAQLYYHWLHEAEQRLWTLMQEKPQ